jgi:hypothetical protein
MSHIRSVKPSLTKMQKEPSAMDSEDDKLLPFPLTSFMDEAHTGLGLIFLLAVSALCGGIVIWLIVTEGIRHNSVQGHDSSDSKHTH